MARRKPLQGDPANPQTRRRRSPGDPSIAKPKPPTGWADPEMPPSFVGVRWACPTCFHGSIWKHQAIEARTGQRIRGAPGAPVPEFRDQYPTVVKRYPKDRFTGKVGVVYEREPASDEVVREVWGWTAQRMLAWLAEHGYSSNERDRVAAANANAAELERELVTARRAAAQAEQQRDHLSDQLQMLQAEYARLRSSLRGESRSEFVAAANPQPETQPTRWEVPPEVARCTYRHWEARKNADLYRSVLERRLAEFRSYRERFHAVLPQEQQLTRAAQRDYAKALAKYAEATDSPCAKDCCTDRELLLADLQQANSVSGS